MHHRPFIPPNMPRSLVVAILSGLAGMFSGIVGAGAAWLGWPLILGAAVAAFAVFWCVMAASGLFFLLRLATGRYRDLDPRPWREQLW